MQLKVEEIAAHLKKVKAEQGDEAFQQALSGFAKNLLLQGETAPFITKLLELLGETLDLAALKEEAEQLKDRREKAQASAKARADFNKAMVEAMKVSMPNLKTQAQFDLVTQTFDVLQMYLNASFGQDDEGSAQARIALNKGLDLAPKLGVIAEQAAESPEITTNPDFVEPPRQFTEEASCAKFLQDLQDQKSSRQLTAWYEANRVAFDRIQTTELRSRLFDAIRLRKKELSS
jgi:hypothetical protein